MAISVGDAVVKLGLDKKDFDRDMKGLTASIKKHQKAIGIAMVAAGGAILAAGVLSIKTFAAMGDEVAKMAKRTGFSTVALSELRHAAELSGASLAGIEKASRTLSGAITDAGFGLETYVRAFESIGLTYEELAQLTPEEQFLRVMEALAGVEDATLRAAIAADLMGRSGTAMLPMLADGAEGLKEMRQEAHSLGTVFDEEAAVKAEEMTDAMKRLGDSVSGVKMAIAEQLIPVLMPLIEKIKKVISNISAWMKEHPKLTQMIVLGTTALGALLVVLGGLLLVLPGLIAALPLLGLAFHAALGPIGLITLAITALIAAGVALWRNWDNIMSLFSSASEKARRDFERWADDIREKSDAMVAGIEASYREWESNARGVTNSIKAQMDEQISIARKAHDEKMGLMAEETLAALAAVDEQAAAALTRLRNEREAIDQEVEARRRQRTREVEGETTAGYEAQIRAEQDAERRVRLEEQLATHLERIDARLWEQEQSDRQAAIRQEMDDLMVRADEEKVAIEASYEENKTVEEAKLEDAIATHESMKALADETLASQVELYQAELKSFQDMNDGKIENAVAFVNEYNGLMEKLGSKERVSVPEITKPKLYPPRPHFAGGLITEPTLLTRLRDMVPYGTMAEKRPEWIVPTTGAGQAITNNFNIAQLIVREQADVRKVARELFRMQQVRV